MKLIIAEKPSVARDIASVIGGVKRGNGFIEAKGYTVTWALGHLVTLADAHDYDVNYKKWRLEDLPIVPQQFRLKVINESKEQYKIVANLLKKAKEVIVATDAGREGQLIYELIALSTGYKGQTKRLWLSSMTEEAIRDAMKRLKSNDEYKNLYHAGFARAQADWLTGINATRAITTRAGTLLTIGRVQTPTLAMIVNRDLEIEQFTPEDYFELEATFAHEKGDYKGKWFDGGKVSRFTRKEDAEAIQRKVAGQPAIVVKVEQKTVNEQPPQLFDLTSLQRAANQKYGFTAEKTLQLAQSLYETHKALTYPRTDSRYLTADITPTLHRRFIAAGKMLPELTPLIPPSVRPTKRVVDGSKVRDHHAIIPTEKTPPASLRNDERRIYELVVKQTLAAILEPAKWAATVIETDVANELFKTTGRVLVKHGWRVVFGGDEPANDKKKEREEDVQTKLPAVAKGDHVETRQVELLEKQTKPPAHYTEASLLSAMEHAGRHVDDEALVEALKERGLGTPATRAAVIEKIKRDGYVQLEKKHLMATDKGRALIAAIHVDVLKSPELTGEWEQRLAQIEMGKYPVRQFIGEITSFTKTVVETIKQTEMETTLGMQLERQRFGACPLCGGDVVESKKSFCCANWNTTGCKFGVWKQISGHKMTQAQVKELLAKKKTKLLKFKSKTGNAFTAHLVLKPDGHIEFAFANRAKSGKKSMDDQTRKGIGKK
jgi:DNA topoisomerase-3